MKRHAMELFVMKRRNDPLCAARRCGKPKCLVCSGNKVLGIKTRKLVLADRNFKEQVNGY